MKSIASKHKKEEKTKVKAAACPAHTNAAQSNEQDKKESLNKTFLSSRRMRMVPPRIDSCVRQSDEICKRIMSINT